MSDAEIERIVETDDNISRYKTEKREDEVCLHLRYGRPGRQKIAMIVLNTKTQKYNILYDYEK